ncbi:MAG: protein kinase [Ktedonobacterales bacterium]
MVVELIGQTLGQYQVVEMIGQGGMARVYKAYQSALDRYVAIKAISAQGGDQGADQNFLARFTTEARLIAKLSHPNIVPVHDFGQEQGWAFIVMEYISGGTVRERLIKAEMGHVLLDLAWTLRIIEQAAQALDFAHSKGVVHRDVKPGNMLLRENDQLLLSDFGIATMLEASMAFSRTGTTVGTPQYMAPEQGLPNGIVDGRTDIYALGVVLYQCVTGRLPYTGDTPIAVIMKHIHEPTPRPAALVQNLPPHVEQIILKAMAKDPRQRYQRAAEMAADLRAASAELVSQRPAGPTVPQNGAGGMAGPLTGAHPVAAPRGAPGAPGTCFRCGAANNPANRFCTTCGYDLSGARAQVDRYLTPSGRPLRCRITFHTGPLAGYAFTLHQDTTTIGRTVGNDIIIPDGTVSRNHARLTFISGQWVIEDAHSANGVFLNRGRVTHPMPLMHGDELRLGDDIASFELVG